MLNYIEFAIHVVQSWLKVKSQTTCKLVGAHIYILNVCDNTQTKRSPRAVTLVAHINDNRMLQRLARNVSKEELTKLVQGFDEQDILTSSGVTLAGNRYIYLSEVKTKVGLGEVDVKDRRGSYKLKVKKQMFEPSNCPDLCKVLDVAHLVGRSQFRKEYTSENNAAYTYMYFRINNDNNNDHNNFTIMIQINSNRYLVIDDTITSEGVTACHEKINWEQSLFYFSYHNLQNTLYACRNVTKRKKLKTVARQSRGCKIRTYLHKGHMVMHCLFHLCHPCFRFLKQSKTNFLLRKWTMLFVGVLLAGLMKNHRPLCKASEKQMRLKQNIKQGKRAYAGQNGMAIG
ncbi:Profilin [Melipona quadrifasciata]|uniref:Profilin n=1 Tax=Melipona quadrifasciata TaxID=166423 RepID=A0A0N0BGB6_9HYME|nr:Profilin [Melipona quadrifasciata]